MGDAKRSLAPQGVMIGDCRTSMRGLIAQGCKVQMCVTSPPYYGLRDYGVEGQLGLEATPAEYVAAMVEVFGLVRDLLADDGTLWLNLGDSYATNGGAGYQGKNGQRADRRHTQESLRHRQNAEGLKPKDMIGIPWRVAFALQEAGWYLRQDIIWCLSGGAAVYARTQKGDMPIMVKDLVRLRPETVQLWNGSKWTQALGWSRSTDTDNALEIELRSGERIGCTRGHQWPTNRGLLRADELKIGDVIETTRLPAPDAPREPDALGVDIAWLCGLYLAEGSMSGDTVQLAGHANESAARLERIERVAASFHGSVHVHVSENGNGATINMDGPIIAAVLHTYVHGDNAHNKGLKVRCWQRSDAWLLALLEGYLAGDGHHDVANDRWRLGFCRNDRLADDLRTLAARLGLPMRLAATTATGFGKEWPAYRGDIRLAPIAHRNARVGSEIVAIRASRARQFWDIGVADDPHTFALASGVLTHNSKPNPMPESVTDRCTKAHEYLFLLAKGERYFFDAAAISEPRVGGADAGVAGWASGEGKHDAISHNRQKGDAKTFRGGQYVNGNKFDNSHATTRNSTGNQPAQRDTRNRRSVWTIATQPYAEAHFATFPPALIEPCILAGSRPGDTVLDPFFGSGTTGQVAQALGRGWIGCELNPHYAALIHQRTAQTGLVLT